MLFKEKPGYYGKRLPEMIEAARQGQVSAYPMIFQVFTERHKPSRLLAAGFLAETLNTKWFWTLLSIEEQMRSSCSDDWRQNRKLTDLFHFPDSEMTEAEQTAVLIFASFHRDGRLREKAVRLLAGRPGALPFIILRKNDWAAPVRNAADHSYRISIKQPAKGELTASLPAIEKLSYGRRADHQEDIRLFYQTFFDPLHKPELIQNLTSEDQRIRKMCYRVLLECSDPDIPFALKKMEAETIPSLRFYVLRCLLRAAGPEHITLITANLLTDKYPRCRSFGLLALYDQDQKAAADRAVEFLLDRSAPVRREARWIIAREQPDFPFADFYRRHLAKGSAAAISGLGETGCKEDADLIKPYLGTPMSGLSRAAMRAVMKLDRAANTDFVASKLTDSNPGVVKEAFRLLIQDIPSGYAEAFLRIYRTADDPNIRKKSAQLLFQCGKWEGLYYMLIALADHTDEIRETAMNQIWRWIRHFNHSFAVPSVPQQNKIREQIDESGSLLPEGTRNHLLFLLK